MNLRVLLVLALLLPFATAAPPLAQPWSPHTTPTEVRDLAISARAGTVAAALAPPQNPSGGAEMLVYDAETGLAKAPQGAVAQGRNFTAVSADGTTIVSVNTDPTQVNIGTGVNQEPRLRLHFNRLTAGTTRWAPDAPEANGSTVLDQSTPVALLLSEDGTRVVLATQTPGRFAVHAFTLGGSTFVPQYTYRDDGNVTAIAGTPGLDTVAVAGALREGNDTYASLLLVPFTTGTPSVTHLDRTNNTSMTSVAIASDGTRAVAGDTSGRLHVVTGTSMAQPLALPGTSGPVTRVLLAHDGSRIAAAMGDSFVMLDGERAPPAVLYNATLAGAIHDVSGNRTLGLVAVVGNGTGVVGFGDLDARPLWRLNAAGRHVAVDAAGTLIAFTPSATTVSVARILRNLTLTHAAGGDAVAPAPVRPQGSTTFPLVVRNTGGAVERMRFEFQRELDLTLVADPPVLAVAPDEVGYVNVTVTTGPLFAGTRSFNVTAVSLASGARDDAVLTLQLRDTPDVRFLLNDTADIAAKPGDVRTVVIGVLNAGASDAAVGIRATQTVTAGEPWDVTIDPASLTLAPNSVTTVRVTVRVPADARDGTSNTLRFALEGANVSDETQLTFRVNPTLGVEVNVVGSRVKFVEPGGVAHYNVTVANTGSLPRRFEAYHEATPQGGKTWVVDMDSAPFLLQPGATRTIPILVFAPQNAQPNTDRVSILVRARSFPEQVNETFVEGNLTLFANAVEPKTTTSTTPENRLVPGPAVGVVLFATVAVALLHRRRRA